MLVKLCDCFVCEVSWLDSVVISLVILCNLLCMVVWLFSLVNGLCIGSDFIVVCSCFSVFCSVLIGFSSRLIVLVMLLYLVSVFCVSFDS